MVDLGTGDGAFVLHAARADPASLVIGIDADASSMVEASRRAARSDLRNAVFVVAAAESLPHELDGVADDVRIHFPWGSLLRGLVHGEESIVATLGRICAVGAGVTALVSIAENDGRVGAVLPEDPWTLGPRFGRHGLELVEVREPTAAEIAGTHSSWAKRLRAGSRRPVTLLHLVRMRGQTASC